MFSGPVQPDLNQQMLSRHQPMPYHTPLPNHVWDSFQSQNPYPTNGVHAFGPTYQPEYGFPSMNYSQQDGQFLFHNPLQPNDEPIPQSYMPLNGYQSLNPYPQHNLIPKQPGGMKTFMNSFKAQDGSVDFNKMINTAGQMVNAVSQVTSLVKGFGGIFKA